MREDLGNNGFRKPGSIPILGLIRKSFLISRYSTGFQKYIKKFLACLCGSYYSSSNIVEYFDT